MAGARVFTESAAAARHGAIRRQRNVVLAPGALLLAVVAFAIPFGNWQQSLLGTSLPRVLIPLLFLLLLALHRRIVFSQLTVLVALFGLAASPSLITGTDDFVPVFANFVGYALLSIVTMNALRGIVAIRFVVMAYLWGLATITAFSFVALLTSFDPGAPVGASLTREIFGVKRLVGTEDNQNAFGLYFTCGIPIALYALVLARRAWAKAAWLVVLLAFLIAVALTLARGPTIGGIFAAIVYLAYRQPRAATRSVIFAAAAVVLALMVWLAASSETIALLSSLDEDGGIASVVEDKSFSSQARFTMFWTLLDIYVNHPLFGIGYGHLPAIVEDAIGQRLGAHNIFFGIGIELGAIPLILFCSIVALAGLIARHVALVATDSATRDLAAVLLATLAGQLANGLVHESYINFMLWLNIGLIAALSRAVARDRGRLGLGPTVRGR